MTAHRRENLGEPLYQMFRAIKRIVDKYDGSMIEEYENGQFEIAIIIYLE